MTSTSNAESAPKAHACVPRAEFGGPKGRPFRGNQKLKGSGRPGRDGSDAIPASLHPFFGGWWEGRGAGRVSNGSGKNTGEVCARGMTL